MAKECLRCKKIFSPKRLRDEKHVKFCSSECGRSGRFVPQKFWKLSNYEDQLTRLKESYLKKVVIQEGCWGWKGAQKTGYGSIRASNKTIGAHRISWMIYKGEIPKDKWILHTCDNRLCSNPEHLFLGDREANMKDMIQKKRNKGASGESNSHAKLTKDIVKNIRNIFSSGDSIRNVAKNFNISYHLAYQIKNNLTWRTI